MNRYIEQLIEDMQEAAKKVPPPGEIWDPVNMDDEGELEDIAFAEKYLHGTPQPLSEIVGVQAVALPPPERLNPSQTSRLTAALMKLLKAYHFYPDFPDGLPDEDKYRLLRGEWEKPHVFVGAGESHIEFCEEYLGDCPFPRAFCECRKAEEQFKREDENNPGFNGGPDDIDPRNLLPPL